MQASRVLRLLLPAILCGSYACAHSPVITIVYDAALDSECASARGIEIRDDWIAELKARRGEYEDLWQAVGPKLIDAAETLTGKSFPTGARKIRLSLCDMPSQSISGISINMRFALSSFTSAPVPMRYKVDTLFHELLHVFLEAYPLKDSARIEQHTAEVERTRDHLHLLALQKAVLLKLNETEALKNVVAIDSQLPGGYYKRAWEIVNATDFEYLGYVAEISQ